MTYLWADNLNESTYFNWIMIYTIIILLPINRDFFREIIIQPKVLD